MDITEIYFAFHRPATVKEIFNGAQWSMAFGHVEAFGYTIDDTWFFFDPGRSFSKLKITHIYDEVQELMAEKFLNAQEVIKCRYDPLSFCLPVHGPMNCVTQCAALVGIRAFTPQGFRKKLLRNNAEVIHGP